MTDSLDVVSEVHIGDLPIDDEPNRAHEFDQWLRVHAGVKLVRSFKDPNGYYVVREGSDQ